MNGRYQDRREAGRKLAELLKNYAGRVDVIVLALPRGGVPVGFEVARSLGAPLDVFLVRKLGVPGHEEVAMGAIATGGIRVLNRDVMEALRIPTVEIAAVESREKIELARRERLYRGTKAPPETRGQTVILVDDGLATGATMLAAVEALRRQGARHIVVAVPVAARETCEALRSSGVETVCALMPASFRAVGSWYDDFSETSDTEVRELLEQAQPHTVRPSTKGPPATGPIEAIRRAARSLRDFDELLARIGDRRFVLIGEASHGTSEFYRMRADLTRRLIEERGFTAVAAEADWPDSLRVDRYARGTGGDTSANEALAGFRRFPQWMWRNTVVVEFVEWLRSRNDALRDPSRAAGFFGLDLYSLHTSMNAVIEYLDRVDPEASLRARRRYACFDHFGEDVQAYGYETTLGRAEPCENEVVQQLLELQRRAHELVRRDGTVARNEHFYAEQNARLVQNAEAYYRSMFRGHVSSWNLRDRHMAETLESLVAHLEQESPRPKIVVWAHNSHLGDARATAMGEQGELNLGQLVRERYGKESFLLGFTTHRGTVTAARDWGGSAEKRRVRPSLPGSHERLLHDAEVPSFWLALEEPEAARALRDRRPERAIGVIYRPETERHSHYFDARLADQFDAVIHMDETSALEPLERTATWDAGEPPETYPFAV